MNSRFLDWIVILSVLFLQGHSTALAQGPPRDPVIKQYWRGFASVQKHRSSDEALFEYQRRFAAKHSPKIINKMIIDLRYYTKHEEAIGYAGVISYFDYKTARGILKSIIDAGDVRDKYNGKYLLHELDEMHSSTAGEKDEKEKK